LLLHLAALLPERQRYLHRHAHDDRPHRHEAAPRVTIDGIAVSEKTIGSVRERVGIVFQDPDDQLIGLTVEEDVAYGPRARKWPDEDVTVAVAEALSAVGLAGFESRLPHHLSAGEKRRVCLAGVLASRPGLLLLDEPSSGLDPRGRRELHVLLADIAATQVIASHDLDFVSRLCTRAVVLDRGAVVAQGPIGDLLSDSSLLRRHGLD
jgi:cobalt/nickel transport system ATP-binding protein